MKTWFTPQYRPVGISIIVVLLIMLILAATVISQGVSERTIAASLLVLSFAVFLVGAILFTGRSIWKWQIPDLPAYLLWERGIVIASTIATALGLALLEELLNASGDTFFARLGLVAYLVGVVILIVAETTYLSKQEWIYSQAILYVMLAFLAEAAFGAALLQTGLTAAWVGWATLIWNLGWLLVMITVRPRDIYFPVLHFVAPLLIGIVLLTQG